MLRQKAHLKSHTHKSPRRVARVQRKTPHKTDHRKLSINTKAFQTTPAVNASNSSTSSAKSQLRQELLKNFTRDGYVLVKSLFSQQEVDKINEDVVSICRGRYGSVTGIRPIDGSLVDNEVIAAYGRISYPHKISPKLRELAIAQPKMVEALQALIGPNVKAISSKYYIQGPGDRGRLWHQDEHWLPTRDRSLVLAIIALDEHTVASGLPLVYPGSHKSGILFPLKPNSSGLTSSNENIIHNMHNIQSQFDGLDDDDESLEATARATATAAAQAQATGATTSSVMEVDLGEDHDDDGGIPIELTPGSVLFVNGYTLQRMMPNINDQALRRCLKVHYSSAESWLPYASEGYTLTPDNRDITMVCGKDPYSYKGITDTNQTVLHSRSGPPVRTTAWKDGISNSTNTTKL